MTTLRFLVDKLFFLFFLKQILIFIL